MVIKSTPPISSLFDGDAEHVVPVERWYLFNGMYPDVRGSSITIADSVIDNEGCSFVPSKLLLIKKRTSVMEETNVQKKYPS
jgi:hypothetical protein